MPNHIHPPVAKFRQFIFGCGLIVGHDPGCAALPPEARCLEIMQGRNKGNFLCIHPQRFARAVEELERGGKKLKAGKQQRTTEVDDDLLV